jgi:hypothetical protein
MRFTFILTAVVTLTVCAEDTSPKTRAQIVAERQKLYPELVRILELSNGVPPEFTAEALLRAAEASFLADRDWKKELVSDAFQTASKVKTLVPRVNAVGNLIEGTPSSMTAQGASAGLDRLTLQMRAVRDQLPMDGAKARDMFSTAGRPSPRRASCEDSMIDNVAPYFEALARVVDAGFSSADKSKDAHAQFMAAEMRKITSPVEIGPAARAIVATSLLPPQLEMVSGAFAGAVEKVSGDDRSFSAVLPTTDRAVNAVIQKLRTAGLSPDALTSAYRKYLMQNLGGARCEDTGASKSTAVAAIGGGVLDGSESILLGIDPATVKPSKIEGKPKLGRFANSEEAGNFRRGFQELMFGSGGRGLSDDQKKTPQWREKFTGLIDAVNEMKRDNGESASDFFYRKAGAYTVVLMAAPPGPDRDRVLPQYIAFLRTTDMQNEDVLGWFHQVQALAGMTLSLNVDEHAKLLAALGASGHPVLRLYAEEETVLPQRPAWAR